MDFAKNREDSTFFDMQKGGEGPDAVEFFRIVQVFEVHAAHWLADVECCHFTECLGAVGCGDLVATSQEDFRVPAAAAAQVEDPAAWGDVAEEFVVQVRHVGLQGAGTEVGGVFVIVVQGLVHLLHPFLTSG